MKNIKQIIGLVLTISPVGLVVGVVGRLTGMNWLLADMMGLLFSVIILTGITLLTGKK